MKRLKTRIQCDYVCPRKFCFFKLTSESQRRSHVHIVHSIHYKWFTGQDPIPIISQYTFVEPENNWQEDYCKKEKLPLLFDVHVSVHRDKFLIIKPTRCTNFSSLLLKWNSTCFGQFLCPSSGVFHCTHSNCICHTGLRTACKQDQNVPSWSCLQAVRKPVWHIQLLCVQWKTPDDGQRNCPKHVEFHFKNKLEKLVHLVGCIIKNIPLVYNNL